MTEATSFTEERVICPSCAHSFNGLRATWCGCLTEERSLVCPRCETCSCSQPIEWKRAFWNDSSHRLKEKRKEANHTDYKPPRFLMRDELVRPLVLVAEDNKLVHLLATRMISGLGYGVVGATDGREALDFCRIYEPDIVITDALMPVFDGREVCERIKNDPILKGTPVIIMSSVYRDTAYANEAKSRFKADEYLLKPISAEKTAAVLRRFVGPPQRRPASPELARRR